MKIIVKKALAFLAAFSFVLTLLPSMQVRAASTVTVTFRAGDVGSFNEELAKSIASDKVDVSSKYVKITVAKPENGELILADVLKEGFGSADINGIFGRITSHENYTLLDASEWDVKLNENIRHNEEYVLDYGALVDPIMYTIRFLDVESYNEATGTYTQEVAAPIINYGNEGDEITIESSLIDDYATAEKICTFTLSKDAENGYSFYYAYVGELPEGEIT